MALNLFFPADPEIEKRNLLLRSDNIHELHCEETTDLKKKFLLYNSVIHDFQSEIESHVTNLFKIKKSISKEVLHKSIYFIKKLYPSVLDRIKIEDIYSTEYGTIIFDWEIDEDNIFSLEIGADTFGYFIEKNGSSVKQVDSKSLENSEVELLNDLSNFLSH